MMSTSPSAPSDCERQSSERSLSSDDEVFMGKLTLKEIRARLLPKKIRDAKRDRLINTNNVSNITDCVNKAKENSCLLIASNKVTCDFKSSENINCLTPPRNIHDIMSKEISYLDLSLNDSYLKLEKQVTDCNQIVDNSINKQPIKNFEQEDELNHEVSSQSGHNNIKIQVQDDKLTCNLSYDVTNIAENIKNVSITTPLKRNKFFNIPVIIQQTPKENANSNNIFKTPKSTVSIKKQKSSLIKKSINNVTFQDVLSPVAAYIKGTTSLHENTSGNGSSAPHCLAHKPHSNTHIPKLVKKPAIKEKDKENRVFVRVFRTPSANTNEKKKLPAKP